RNPLADICRAILELGAIRFATSQKYNCVSIHELDLSQIQNNAVVLSFDFEESLQLYHLFRIDSTTQGKGYGLRFRRYLNSQRHRFSPETTVYPGYNAMRM